MAKIEIHHHDRYIHHHDCWDLADGCHIDKINDTYYVQNGMIHRMDGPAVVWCDGYREWYLFDQKSEFDDWIKELEKADEEHATMMKLKWG